MDAILAKEGIGHLGAVDCSSCSDGCYTEVASCNKWRSIFGLRREQWA